MIVNHSAETLSDFIKIKPLTANNVTSARHVIQRASLNNIVPSLKLMLTGKVLHLGLAAIFMISYNSCSAVWDAFSNVCVSLLLACIVNVTATLFYTYGPPLYDMYQVEKEYMECADTRFFVAVINDPANSKETHEKVIGTIAIVPKKNMEGPKTL